MSLRPRRPLDHSSCVSRDSGGVVRDNPQVNKAVADHTALGRAGVPEDVGPVIAALLSDDFGWVNAQRIEVAGGMQI